jgi:hypothetical protein
VEIAERRQSEIQTSCLLLMCFVIVMVVGKRKFGRISDFQVWSLANDLESEEVPP